METTEKTLKKLLTDLEHFQQKAVALQDALNCHKQAIYETKEILKKAIMDATMQGRLILREGNFPYIIAGYILMIDFDPEELGIINVEVIDVHIIDVSLFNQIQL